MKDISCITYIFAENSYMLLSCKNIQKKNPVSSQSILMNWPTDYFDC